MEKCCIACARTGCKMWRKSGKMLHPRASRKKKMNLMMMTMTMMMMMMVVTMTTETMMM